MVLPYSKEERVITSTKNGCSIYRDCLTCPLPKCIFDETLLVQVGKATKAAIVELFFPYSMSRSEIRDVLQVTDKAITEAVGEENERRRQGVLDGLKEYKDINWDSLTLGNGHK